MTYLEISRIVFWQVFIECLFAIFFVFSRTFFSHLKNDFSFLFFSKISRPLASTVQLVRQHSIDHRSFVGDIAAPSCESRRAYTSLISEGHTARQLIVEGTKPFVRWLSYIGPTLFLSLSLSASFARHSFS